MIGLIAEEVGCPAIPAAAAMVGRHLDLVPRIYWVAWLAGELHPPEGLELAGLEGLQAWMRVRRPRVKRVRSRVSWCLTPRWSEGLPQALVVHLCWCCFQRARQLRELLARWVVAIQP